MRLLAFPEDVSIGGLEAQADRLADDAARTAAEAEALVLSILRGDGSWRTRKTDAQQQQSRRPAGPRAVA